MAERIQIGIVEDNRQLIMHYELLINDFFPEIEIVGKASSVEQGKLMIENEKPPILLLDVDIEGGTSFEILQQLPLNYKPAIVFITAYDKYALRALKLGSVDYLIKPFETKDFIASITKAKAQTIHHQKNSVSWATVGKQLSTNAKGSEKNIVLSHSNKISVVPIKSILYVKADGRYSSFYIEGQPSIVVSKNLKSFEFLTEDHDFYKVHRSYIIQMSMVKEFNYDDGGTIILKDDSIIPVASRNVTEFVKKLKSE